MEKLQLISGRGNQTIAKKISKLLRIPLTPIKQETLADGEIYVRVLNSVRNSDVFVIQSLSRPVNDNLMELLITIDALKRASAKEITVVCPYLCYSRQDRKAVSREPITSKLIADLITRAGADRLLTVDLHVDQIQGFYDIPVDVLIAYPLFAQYLLKKKYKNMVVVAPDTGAVRRGRKLATLLNVPLVIVDKRRPEHNKAEIVSLIGDVEKKTAVILDDIIDTGGTVSYLADVLKERGAKDVIICATHALFSKEAPQKLQDCAVSKILVADTVELTPDKKIKKVEIISMVPILAKVIKRIHDGKSLGKLFKWEDKEAPL